MTPARPRPRGLRRPRRRRHRRRRRPRRRTRLAIVIEARVNGGRPYQCTVTETMRLRKSTQLFVRCDTRLLKTSVPPIAALAHGTPHAGQSIRVLVDDNDDATWDTPAARHPLSAIFAMLGVFVAITLAWRRLSSG